ncbi:hypothetical protein BDP27DRAFT_255516 [Rhodocollybia butyracea]|uniref:Uncharacterized protein n=1 Tax=Rhodocollybia butyracea TaxID=206335 RepID=A0A9P5PGK4_9AGAR|nr:hypothetical protein BDP27DRAFT_255516 [Rhodocollybia butyracea]
MMQLETGDLRPLIEVLAKWQYVELQIFLFELMACLPDERLNAFTSQRSHVVESIRAEYSASSTIRKEQITRAFIRAMKLLLQAGQLAAEAAIDAGLLTVILLVVAAEGFNVPLQRRNSGVSLTLRESKEALMVLALYEDPDFKLRLACWPFMLFWPQAEDFTLPECFMARLEPAQVRPGSSTLLSDAWRLRLGAINALMSVRQFTRSHVEYVRSALTELVWLLCHSELDSSLQMLSSSMLLKTPYQFYRFWPQRFRTRPGKPVLSSEHSNLAQVFFFSTRSLADFRHCLPKRKASKHVDYFLEFITFISREFPVLAKPLCESRIASLLLSVLSDIDPTMTYPSWTPNSNVVPRDQLLRNTLSKLSTVRQRPDEFLRILDIGVTISVSLLMIEDSSTSCISDADDINELWKSATMDRLRPILSSALRQIWMLMAFQNLSLKNTVINKQTDLTRLLICFQALAMVFNVNVYSTPSSSVES